jgi:hypothetical protein
MKAKVLLKRGMDGVVLLWIGLGWLDEGHGRSL